MGERKAEGIRGQKMGSLRNKFLATPLVYYTGCIIVTAQSSVSFTPDDAILYILYRAEPYDAEAAAHA